MSQEELVEYWCDSIGKYAEECVNANQAWTACVITLFDRIQLPTELLDRLEQETTNMHQCAIDMRRRP